MKDLRKRVVLENRCLSFEEEIFSWTNVSSTKLIRHSMSFHRVEFDLNERSSRCQLNEDFRLNLKIVSLNRPSPEADASFRLDLALDEKDRSTENSTTTLIETKTERLRLISTRRLNGSVVY